MTSWRINKFRERIMELEARWTGSLQISQSVGARQEQQRKSDQKRIKKSHRRMILNLRWNNGEQIESIDWAAQLNESNYRLPTTDYSEHHTHQSDAINMNYVDRARCSCSPFMFMCAHLHCTNTKLHLGISRIGRSQITFRCTYM